jgi:hypothetical protein
LELRPFELRLVVREAAVLRRLACLLRVPLALELARDPLEAVLLVDLLLAAARFGAVPFDELLLL